jgi:hypothetical protein
MLFVFPGRSVVSLPLVDRLLLVTAAMVVGDANVTVFLVLVVMCSASMLRPPGYPSYIHLFSSPYDSRLASDSFAWSVNVTNAAMDDLVEDDWVWLIMSFVLVGSRSQYFATCVANCFVLSS